MSELPSPEHASNETRRLNPHIFGRPNSELPSVKEMRGILRDESSPAQTKYARTQERRMHDEFEAWLRHHAHEIYFDHSRMDRATTNRTGNADFVLQSGGLVLNLEFKINGGKLTKKQREVHEWLNATGNPVHVCYSVTDAIRITRETFQLP